MRQEKIDYPNNRELDVAIDAILDKAYPKQKGVIESLVSMYRQIGFGNILHGMTLLMGLVFLCYIGILALEMNAVEMEEGVIQLTMILCLPLMFQGILGLSILNEHEQNVYELGMTCRYTQYHMLALRMIVVSISMILFNGIMCVGLWKWDETGDFVQNAFLSVTVTLIYSVAYMKTLLGGIGLVRQAALYGIWTGVILLLKTVFPMAYHYILYQLPLLVHVAIWCLAIVALGKDISRFLQWNCKYNLNTGGSQC